MHRSHAREGGMGEVGAAHVSHGEKSRSMGVWGVWGEHAEAWGSSSPPPAPSRRLIRRDALREQRAQIVALVVGRPAQVERLLHAWQRERRAPPLVLQLALPLPLQSQLPRIGAGALRRALAAAQPAAAHPAAGRAAEPHPRRVGPARLRRDRARLHRRLGAAVPRLRVAPHGARPPLPLRGRTRRRGEQRIELGLAPAVLLPVADERLWWRRHCAVHVPHKLEVRHLRREPLDPLLAVAERVRDVPHAVEREVLWAVAVPECVHVTDAVGRPLHARREPAELLVDEARACDAREVDCGPSGGV
mmetsp:Transcript_18445/g.53329  ORF Transcript_18445/g.53329 Transcript_18445/m.53329 type:complete len:304 (-) Transcript_18445:1006-1917(-)